MKLLQKASPQSFNQSARRKAHLRDRARLLRRSIPPQAAQAAAIALAESGLKLLSQFDRINPIGGYYPIRDEIDPLPLLNVLHSNGFRIALPTIKDGAVTFREWRPGLMLVKGPFGTKEPEETQGEAFPNPVLVPLLAFDRMGNRLGYGAGYYDAILRALRSADRVTAIGVGFNEQEVPEIPREPQDEPLDMILTPAGLIICRN
ncbi:MAG TPA: 5-formyltetrahydrofolate cyclo-ligase [Hyphomicrobiales bacterium]|nr:5-formyltetrahydrofolate cyclo-ligase [Hyphomicrobiales bacterium]